MYQKAAASIARVYAKGALAFAQGACEPPEAWAGFLQRLGEWTQANQPTLKRLRPLRRFSGHVDAFVKHNCPVVESHLHFRNFVRLLIAKDRILLTPLIAQAYWDAWDCALNRLHVHCIHAVFLNEEQKTALGTQLNQTLDRPIRITWQEDDRLINGLKLVIDGKTLDLSAKALLFQLRQALLSFGPAHTQLS